MLVMTIKSGHHLCIGDVTVKLRRKGNEIVVVIDAPSGKPIARQRVAEAFLFSKGWRCIGPHVREHSPWEKDGAPGGYTLREALVLENWHMYGENGENPALLATQADASEASEHEAVRRYPVSPIDVPSLGDLGDLGGLE